jgi:hypothetical protein
VGNISFNLLLTEVGQYTAFVQLDTSQGRSLIKKFNFNIIDTDNCGLKVYRIKSIKQLTDFPWSLTNATHDYIFRKQPNTTNYYDKYQQFIPVSANKENGSGVKLNHLLIIQVKDNNRNNLGEESVELSNYLENNYFHRTRTIASSSDPNDQIIYHIYISKSFWFEPDKDNYEKIRDKSKNHILYRDDYIFCPEYHYLENIDDADGDEKYMVHQDEALCVIPDMKFGEYINDYEWEFINVSKVNPTSVTFDKNISINEPFISNTDYKSLDRGYYDITFRYRLSNDITDVNEIKMKSAFRII